MRTTSATGSRGFTLLELLVVLAIILLIATAWPLSSSRVFGAQQLRNETQQLAVVVRLAQLSARATSSTERIELFADGKAYRMRGEEHRLTPGLTLSIRNESRDTTASSFFLFADGSSSGETLAISSGRRQATLRVLPVTGRLVLTP